MKKIISIFILILFWISGYFGVTKILEMREKYLEMKEVEEIAKNLKDLIPTEEELRKTLKEQKLLEKKAEEERLNATLVRFSEECKIESNSTLWQNKEYWFKMCIPQDYNWFSPYAWLFQTEVFDWTEWIWLSNLYWRKGGWFSPIWITALEKPIKVKLDSNAYIFETKTHIIEFYYDKNNQEHIEAIKSLKLYNKNK